MICTATINIVLNLLLTPTHGMIGAALAGMVSIAFPNIYILIFIKRKYGRITGYFPLFQPKGQ
jgi:O-antigen/teichoic acid export membrane protein